ncbi:glutathione transferase GstA [Microvirga guangxiensis]|uniref:Glutathione S-transferase n=1 Tax=Microvirga guangxiensis TaxID=549386 RepID=A0A1G5BT47_9HYPH|nr:glutathione transferase GstA [Microvirga guangxiensis]SCX93247.1 glutathione S-transferase [Microvirga guangxiensis]
MKLYYSPGASSLAPHIVIHEAGLEVEFDRVDLNTQTTASGLRFCKVNPKGNVPALALRNGEVLTEVSVILEYLADHVPDRRLLPAPGSFDRYRVQEWVGFIGTELHKGFGPLWDRLMPDAARRLAVQCLQRQLTYLDRCLDGRSYLMGDKFTIADAYCFTVLSWARFHRLDLGDYPAVRAFMHEVANRPMVRKAMEAEGLMQAA